MLNRRAELRALADILNQFPIAGIVGARQVGKTTLARMFCRQQRNPAAFFDLENPEDLARLSDPMLALKPLRGLVVIDEIQRLPELFPILRVLADRPRRPARFLILGSASPDLLHRSSESLAGRIVYHALDGFSSDEVGADKAQKLWLRGGFPLSFLAKTEARSYGWRASFITSFLERDLPQLGITIRSVTLRRFWTMLAHSHAQEWNASEFGRSFGIADTTARRYLDLLTSALVIRQLAPWHENIKKRQVRSPRIYIKDSGLFHGLLGLKTMRDLEAHPKVGASWEGFVIQEIIRRLRVAPSECFYWRTHAGAELDLLVVRGRRRWGFEIKRTSSPRITPSMRHALKDLKLRRLTVIHAGRRSFPLANNVEAMAFEEFLSAVKPL